MIAREVFVSSLRARIYGQSTDNTGAEMGE